ncbi:hypothetical protein H0H81_010972 [Sphagnurus paluster]|uniref:Uncharacterized protein n=1 Tax=Sphagnurus paluster TaxID=117069 RepID=A0A9P7KJK1_9AGAR|nr:hypothetical protein H0H81_010972 [Sphagnurus paluster]
MPIHLPDKYKYHPKVSSVSYSLSQTLIIVQPDERVVAVFRNQDRQKRYDFLDISMGISRGLDLVRLPTHHPNPFLTYVTSCHPQTYWKDGYKVVDASGYEDVCCPGLLYPRSLSVDNVWALMAERLGAYVFPTPPNWRPDPDPADSEGTDSPPTSPLRVSQGDRERERDAARCRDREESYAHTNVSSPSLRESMKERCPMCADRYTYWAVSPPVFLSRHSRRWHVHVDCLQHLMPRRQFGLKPVDAVEYV